MSTDEIKLERTLLYHQRSWAKVGKRRARTRGRKPKFDHKLYRRLHAMGCDLERPPVGRICIYALIDPREGQVYYIGQTRNPWNRIETHIKRPHSNELERRVKALRAERLLPILRVIEVVDELEWEDAERRWIAFYREHGQICNVEDGGVCNAPWKF